MRFFNIPGLCELDESNITRNKTEVKKAFETTPNSIIVFVFSHVGGQLSASDVAAFNAIDRSFCIKRESLLFIVNRSPSPPDYSLQAKVAVTLRRISGEDAVAIHFTPEIDAKHESAETVQKMMKSFRF